MSTERELRHTRHKPVVVPSENLPPPQTPPVPAKEVYEQQTPQNMVQSTEAELRHMGEQIKEKAHVVGEQIQTQAKSTLRSIFDELRFIKGKFVNTRAREHCVQLAATFIVASLMHVLLNVLSSRVALSTHLFAMYLEHWQPWSFIVGNAVLSRAIDHLPIGPQYAWACTAFCWLSAIMGWSSFPFGGILEKAAMSLPLNARNFIWLSVVPPVVNFVAKKIRSF